MKQLILLSTLTFFIYTSHLSANFYESSIEPWGCDHALGTHAKVQQKKMHIFQKLCNKSIYFFQNYISEIDGPRSTFYPTSSEYARLMISEHGVLRGIALGCDRLLRENHDPWVYRTIKKHGVLRKLDD